MLGGLAVMAAADAPDPKLAATNGSAVVNADNSITLTVSGGWVWTTHKSDCNANRFAAGWAVDWNDSSQPGNVVGQANGTGPIVDVGTAAGNALNGADNSVHYAPNAPRCGVYDPGVGYNSGTWGPMVHTYPAGTTTIAPCVVMYDLHQSTGTAVVAGGKNHNTDNSVEENDKTPLGNGCFPFNFPHITTNATDAVFLGSPIHDVAHLAGASNDAKGSITFTAYGPGDNTCTNLAFTSAAISVNGSGDYQSGNFTPTAAGTYRWIAHYSGDSKNAEAITACADPAEASTVTAPHPGIEVLKDGPAQAHEGDKVTYTFKVTNTGDVVLTNVTVDDDVLGHVGDIASLAVGASKTLTKDFTVPVGNADITNTVTACGDDPRPVQVCDDDHHKLTPIHPKIALVKGGPAMAHVGDTITYTFAASNPGDVPLHAVSLTDPRCASLPVYVSGDSNSDQVMQITETWNYSCQHVITANDPDPLPNTATVTGIDPLGKTVTAQASHSVNIIHPDITVVKSGPAQAHEGDVVTYSFKVTNTGDVTLTNASVDDNVIGHIGDLASLAVGASTTLTKDFTIPPNSTSDIENTGTVCADDPLAKVVCDDDHHKTDPIHPKINLTKDGPDFAHIGDTVTYTFAATNPGDVPLTSIHLTDPRCDSAPQLTGKSGGNQDNVLNEPETWSWSCTHVVTSFDPDPMPNTATVTGVDPLQKTVSAQASHTVDLIHPDITVVKAGAAMAHSGDSVTYTFKVTNSGDTALSNVNVDDDVLGHVGTLASLGSGASQTLSKQFTVPAGGGDITNTVTACGVDRLLLQVCDDDHHTLTRANPAITVIKSGPTTAHVGDTVTYTFKVTNTGDTVLNNVSVDDDVLGHIGNLTTLAKGASTTLTKDFIVPAGVTSVINTVIVCADDPLAKQVCDDDHHRMDPIHPKIALTKDGPAMAKVGDTVNYTFKITNPGDVALSNVTLTDPRCDASPTLVSKSGGNTDNTLDLTESWSYTCAHVVTASDPDPLPNTATAKGDDPLHKTVTAQASHTVDLIHPAINVVKSGPAQAHEGDVVTYSFKVTNTGDIGLTGVSVDDNVLGHIGNIASLASGASQTLTKNFTVPVGNSPIVNTATACGTDPTQAQFCDTDNHNLDPIHPAIGIIKTANPISVEPGATVTYTYVVTNTGDVGLHDVTVDDDVLGHIGDIPSLAVGASSTLTKASVVTETSPLRNVATAVGTDPLGKKVSANDDAVISVVLGKVLARTGSSNLVGLGVIAVGLVLLGFTLTETRRRHDVTA